MDIVFNNLTKEVPFDAVSNLINTSITRYKDGKDESLMGGQTERDSVQKSIDNLYNHLKTEYVTEKNEHELVGGMTIYGRHAITNDNDVISTESSSIAQAITDISNDAINGSLMIHYQREAIAIAKLSSTFKKHLDKCKLELNTHGINLDEDNNVDYIHLDQMFDITKSNAHVAIPYSNIKDYMRATIGAFKKNGEKEYFTRFKKKFVAISDIARETYEDISEAVNKIVEWIGESEINILKKHKQYKYEEIIRKLENKAKTIKKMYIDTLKNDSIVKSDDPFPFVYDPMVFDIATFLVKKNSPTKSYPITKEGAEMFKNDKEHEFYDGPSQKMVFASVNSCQDRAEIIRQMSSNINPQLYEAIPIHREIKKRSWTSVTKDMNIGEFKESIKKFKEVTKDFENCYKDALITAAKTTFYTSGILGKYATNLAKHVASLNEKGYRYNASADVMKLSRLVYRCAIYSCIDLFNTLQAMYTLYSEDVAKKLQLYQEASATISAVCGRIQFLEKQNDK